MALDPFTPPRPVPAREASRGPPPLVLLPGQGLRYWATHSYDDAPSENSPPLRFGLTSEDEMAILLGFHATP